MVAAREVGSLGSLGRVRRQVRWRYAFPSKVPEFRIWDIISYVTDPPRRDMSHHLGLASGWRDLDAYRHARALIL